MKYKKLTKEQIIISLDRLTRFKNTREKYLRVFSDILVNCLIEPKLKRNEIANMDFELLANYVSEIFNNSLPKFGTDIILNNKVISYIQNYENSVFINNSETKKLLDNNIDYVNAIKLVQEDCPVNLKWLKELIYILNKNIDSYLPSIINIRENKLLKYPVEEVLLVEGITEEILLPAFSKLLSYDFYAKGIQIIAAGGKNQVVKMYYELSQELKLPIFVLLDKDAEENIQQIKPRLRNQDRIHLVSCGEFEDLLPKSLIVKTVNSHFENFVEITESDFSETLPTARILEEIFKTKGLHEFKKAEFAKLVKENILSENDISTEVQTIIDEIRVNKKTLDSKICS